MGDKGTRRLSRNSGVDIQRALVRGGSHWALFRTPDDRHGMVQTVPPYEVSWLDGPDPHWTSCPGHDNCAFCYGRQATEGAWLHGADPDELGSYVPLCHPCHTSYDHETKSALASVHNRNRDQKAIVARLNERRWCKNG